MAMKTREEVVREDMKKLGLTRQVARDNKTENGTKTRRRGALTVFVKCLMKVKGIYLVTL